MIILKGPEKAFEEIQHGSMLEVLEKDWKEYNLKDVLLMVSINFMVWTLLYNNIVLNIKTVNTIDEATRSFSFHGWVQTNLYMVDFMFSHHYFVMMNIKY